MAQRQWRSPPIRASVSLRIEPESRVLQNAGSHQQLLAVGTYADGSTRDLTAVAKWALSDPSLVLLDQNDGVPLSSRADGKVAAIAVVDGTRAGGAFLKSRRGERRAYILSSARDIGGIFTRKGCNNSTCHGGVKGRGGLKLSPGALYPADDYEWIVKGGAYQVLTAAVTGARNPRIDLTHPEKSLLLLKPTGTVRAARRREALSSRFC